MDGRRGGHRVERLVPVDPVESVVRSHGLQVQVRVRVTLAGRFPRRRPSFAALAQIVEAPRPTALRRRPRRSESEANNETLYTIGGSQVKFLRLRRPSQKVADRYLQSGSRESEVNNARAFVVSKWKIKYRLLDGTGLALYTCGLSFSSSVMVARTLSDGFTCWCVPVLRLSSIIAGCGCWRLR